MSAEDESGTAAEESTDSDGDHGDAAPGGSRRRRPKELGCREGDVVAVCDPSSTTSKVILGKVLHVASRRREVHLAHLAPDPEQDDDTRGPAYKFVVGRDSWWEDTAALIHPIDVRYETGNRVYRLHTRLNDIEAFFNTGRKRRRRH